MPQIARAWRERFHLLVHRLKDLGGRLYLVGGSVRDLFLGRSPRELDLYLEAGNLDKVIAMVEDLAHTQGDRMVVLHAEPRVMRWVMEGHGWADLQAGSTPIEENLAARDFTVNAMALPWPFRSLKNDCIDPFGGRRDLERRLLRLVREDALRADPLRVMRAYRLAAQFDFDIESGTHAWIRASLALLARVPVERLTFELLKWFQAPAVNQVFQLADHDGLWPVLFPELAPLNGCPQGGFHHRDVWGHTVEVFCALDEIFQRMQETPFGPHFRKWLDQDIFTMQMPRRPFFKILALLHDVGKPKTRKEKRPGVMVFWGHAGVGAGITRTVLERMRFSRRAVQVLVQAVQAHLRPLEVYKQTHPNYAPLRLLRQYPALGPWLVVISCADQMGKAGPLMEPARVERFLVFTQRTLALFFDPSRHAHLRFPVNARFLMRHFDLEPGPALGELLRRLRKAWIEGHCETPEQALKLAAQWLNR